MKRPSILANDASPHCRSETEAQTAGSLQASHRCAQGPLIGTPEFKAAILRRLGETSHSEDGTAAVHGFRAAVARLIERPFTAQTVATIAEATGMSPSAFTHQFQKHFGVSPMAFLEHERLRCAMDLLHTTPLSIAAIARKVGHSNRADFSRAFREAYGISPSIVRTAARSPGTSA